MRSNVLAPLGLLTSLVIFYPHLFLANSGAIIGDHMVQHYPWAHLLGSSLKNFTLPFWTSLIHCGFPIAAESQIGIFYLPNLILFSLLPFHWAYSYTSLFHYFLAGWGTYLYLKQMNLSSYASFIAAFIFLFGTAYGGAYYNITSLKTISWFPLILLLFEKYYETQRKKYLLFAAISMWLALVAGYMQVAIFMFLILIIYNVLKVFIFYERKNESASHRFRFFFWIILTFAAACILAIPQIFLTFELAMLSNRVSLTEEYAYVGSMSPIALSTLLLPNAQGLFRGNSIYSGVFSVLLLFCALFSKQTRNTNLFRLWGILIIISLLLALGRWSPLYVGLVKLTHFYSFRTPMKFLVFICFGLAVLCGCGFDRARKAFRTENTEIVSKAAKAYLAVVSFAIVSSAGLLLLITYGRNLFIRFGHWFITYFVHGRAGHPHSLEIYKEKVSAYIGKVDSLFFLDHDPYFFNQNVWVYSTVLIGALFALLVLWRKKTGKIWLLLGVIFLAVDLYVFAIWDIKRDYGSYDDLIYESKITRHLIDLNQQGEVGRVYGFRSGAETLPLMASVNMLYGVESIGAYSPFVMKRYHDLFGSLGSIDDSNVVISPSYEGVSKKFHLLDLLDVSHVVSRKELKHARLKLIAEDSEKGDVFLYENLGPHQRAFFVSEIQVLNSWNDLKSRLEDPSFDPHKVLLIEPSELYKITSKVEPINKEASATVRRITSQDDKEVWSLETNKPGFFIITNMMYPGWQTTINGKFVPILKAYGIFQAVQIQERGKYEIVFSYHPFLRKTVVL